LIGKSLFSIPGIMNMDIPQNRDGTPPVHLQSLPQK